MIPSSYGAPIQLRRALHRRRDPPRSLGESQEVRPAVQESRRTRGAPWISPSQRPPTTSCACDDCWRRPCDQPMVHRSSLGASEPRCVVIVTMGIDAGKRGPASDVTSSAACWVNRSASEWWVSTIQAERPALEGECMHSLASFQFVLSGAGSQRSQVSHLPSGTTARTPSLTQTHVGSGWFRSSTPAIR